MEGNEEYVHVFKRCFIFNFIIQDWVVKVSHQHRLVYRCELVITAILFKRRCIVMHICGCGIRIGHWVHLVSCLISHCRHHLLLIIVWASSRLSLWRWYRFLAISWLWRWVSCIDDSFLRWSWAFILIGNLRESFVGAHTWARILTLWSLLINVILNLLTIFHHKVVVPRHPSILRIGCQDHWVLLGNLHGLLVTYIGAIHIRRRLLGWFLGGLSARRLISLWPDAHHIKLRTFFLRFFVNQKLDNLLLVELDCIAI